jgi:hypothetical protein
VHRVLGCDTAQGAARGDDTLLVSSYTNKTSHSGNIFQHGSVVLVARKEGSLH